MCEVAVAVRASDEVSRAGTARVLEAQQIRVTGPAEQPYPAVVVVVEPVLNDAVVKSLRDHAAVFPNDRPPRYIVVTQRVDNACVLAATECGVAAIVHRKHATGRRLEATVHAIARGAAYFPSSLQGALFAQLDRLRQEVMRPRGLSLSGLEPRERDVLALVAEGLNTEEISTKLSYSPRTVHSALSGLMQRFQLRSRTHAVAFAMRTGAI